MGFSRQEYWSRLPCLPPRHLPDLGIESVSPTSPASAGKFCTISVTWEALYTKYLIRNARLDESQLEKDCWEKYPQHQICRWYYPNGRKWRGTKGPPDEGEKVKKDGLNLNIQKTKIMASSPITSWQIEGGKWKQWQTLFSWAPKSLRTSVMMAAMKLKDPCSLEGKLWQT